MFRELKISTGVKGRIFLHSMPGRRESWTEFQSWLVQTKIDRIVCLAEHEEIKEKSADYFDAINSKRIPCIKSDFPIPDYGVPRDRESFVEYVKSIAEFIIAGETILIHCAGGIGRTGTFATCLLHALRIESERATELVYEAGSYAETSEQRDLVNWHASYAIN
jgi:protein-tyrosine phosphatase